MILNLTLGSWGKEMSVDRKNEAEPANIELLETLYRQYQTAPNELSPAWRQYFQAIERQTDAIDFFSSDAPKEDVIVSNQRKDSLLSRLIEAYRVYGHLAAAIDPIELEIRKKPAELTIEHHGFCQADWEKDFPTFGLMDQARASLRDIVNALHSLYCGSIGFEYWTVGLPSQLKEWMRQRIESGWFARPLPTEQRLLILQCLNRSELFESFLQTKHVGQKRFSLEGAETLIPMLALLVEKSGENGVEEIALGMAHRGRINVLTNVLHKSYQEMLAEFEEGYIPESFEGTGDVKYHKGYISDVIVTQTGKKVKLTLPPNPSHLESVDPVVEGIVRAKQFLRQDESLRRKIVPVLIHGDGALSGQGVIYETLQFCRLPGYETGGTLHVVVNNQIGFTTIPRDARSTPYCTDIAKAFGLPVFHVNAEDPEACVLAMLTALEIRQVFHCDVFIDLNCYRKYGHNETDEPAFTQPLEYKIIRKKSPIRDLYKNFLVSQGAIEKDEVERLEQELRKGLQDAYDEVKGREKQPSLSKADWTKATGSEKIFQPFITGVSRETLVEVAKRFSVIPAGFHLHAKLENLVNERLKMLTDEKPVDWGMAEHLAYASLLWEGLSIRLSGQDVCRGTFSHRHAVWMDQNEEQAYFPLAHLKEGQGRFKIWNSPLSEFAVLGFEYGYSVACPNGLTIWEAQFGDFSNGAQVIIDQYLISGEQKWGQPSGLVLFLPHGYEGQGPEHSSGRLERFLSLAGHQNIQVANPTTPAQFFHLLRRQALRPLHKPLVVFTPKGLLRHPTCVSQIKQLTEGSFQEILDDSNAFKSAEHVAICSGRVYYDLINERDKIGRTDSALIRLEQLYPVDQERLKEIIASYPHLKKCSWVQEEPQNMGGWHFIRPYLEEALPAGIPLQYVGRATSASPATGSHSRHLEEYRNLLNQVFTYEK